MDYETSFSQTALPVFKGENYDLWTVKMEAYLEALDLWEAVEKDYEVLPLSNNPTIAQIKNHKEKKNLKSKGKIMPFAGASITIFTRIMTFKSAKAIWDYLKGEYVGDEIIQSMQVLNLMREFELQRMKESETIKEYSNKLLSIANKIRLLGSDFADSRIVEKILVTILERRPNVKCSRCNQIGHEAVIYKANIQQVVANAQNAQQNEDQLFVATCFSSSSSSELWLIDSGCTNHMTYDRELFKCLNNTEVKWVRIGNGEQIPVKGKGSIAITSHIGTKTLSDVLCVPKINQNFLSVGQLLEKGFKVIFEDKSCKIKDPTGLEMFKVKMKSKSFLFDPIKEQVAFPVIASSIDLWHKRLGHFHHLRMNYMLKNQLVHGVPFLTKKLAECEACNFEKQTRKVFPESSWRASQKLQLVHTVVAGPQRNPSLRGKVAVVFWKFKAHVENQSNCRIQILRSDNGKEYIANQFQQFCDEAGDQASIDGPLHFSTKWNTVDDAPIRGTRLLSDIYQKSNAEVCNIVVCEPASFEEAAMEHKWLAAMKEEISMIEKNQTWMLVPRPHDRNVIGVKWVFPTKFNLDGSLNKHKARLVVKGYSQIFGVDYAYTFAPIARLDIIRLLLAIDAQNGWQALYGLKQAPKVWYSRINEYLLSLGFKRSQSKATLYVKHVDADILIISLYVDDLLVTGSNPALINQFKQEMKDAFEMIDLSLMNYFLGMEINQKKNEIFICQKKYAKEILKKF
ncbi:Copia protein, partial [Mucuna pruriens]